MADPLSISASIAGVVTLVDVVFIRLMKYVRSAKNAVKETEALAREINMLGGALNSLSRLARSFDDEPSSNKLFRMYHIDACNDILMEIDKKLKKPDDNSLKKKVIWPLTSIRVKEMLDDLSRHKQSVDLALAANSMDLLLRSLARERDLQATSLETLNEIKKTREVTSRIRRDQEREKILSFFLECNPQQNYDMSLKLRHPRTGLWLLRTPQFQTWLSEESGRLWLTGIPGAGKTVLAGTIIEAALAQCDDTIAAGFFFCDYKVEMTHIPTNILGALAYQIAIQKEETYAILERYFTDLHPTRGLPRDPDMVKLYDRVFFVVDGIDECGKYVENVLETLCSVSEDSDNISMALLSHDFVCERVAAHTEDITEYVTAEIEERIRTKRLRVDDLELKGEIVHGLIDGAAGMFRWVACQLDHLQDCTSDKECRDALKKLPPTLNDTYLRILGRIPPNKMKIVELALNFIAFTWPRLSIQRLREILSIPENGRFLETSGIIRESAIQRLCSSFIRKSNDEDYFEFAHFSVQEFLQNDSLLDGQFKQFLVSESRCNVLMAIHCLNYLQLKNFDHHLVAAWREIDYMNDRNIKHPLYQYATYYWPIYARYEWSNEELFESAIELFDHRKTNTFISWIVQFLVECEGYQYDYENNYTTIEKILSPEFTTLHVACSLVLPAVCSVLLERNMDTAKQSPFGTPVQCAIHPFTLFRDTCDYETSDFYRHLMPCFGTGRSTECATQTIEYSGDFSVITLLLSQGAPLDERDVGVLSSGDNRENLSHLVHGRQSFKRFMQVLNLMIDQSHFHRKVYLLWWEVAVRHRSSFVLDPDFVNPKISLSSDVQEQRLISAVRVGDMNMFAQIQNVSCFSLPDILDPGGKRLLHMALEDCANIDKCLAIVNLLLKEGCSLFDTDKNGHLPIHSWFLRYNLKDNNYDYEPLAKFLIDNGMTATFQGSNGRNLLHSKFLSSQCLSAFLRCEEKSNVEYALRMVDNEGYTPLSRALKEHWGTSASILFEWGEKDPETWQSPIPTLLLAVDATCEDVFRGIYNAGAALETTGNGYLTPLHYVSPDNSLEFVNYLKSLYPNACNIRIDGKLPIDTCLEKLSEGSYGFQRFRHKEVIKTLYPVRLQDDEKGRIWEQFTKLLNLKTMFQLYLNEVVMELIRLGCLKSYESSFQKPALLSLLKFDEGKLQGLRDIWLTSNTICGIVYYTNQWTKIQSSPLIVRLLKAAVVSEDTNLIKLLLGKGVDVHRIVEGMSALEISCQSTLEMFQLLLDYVDGGRLDDVSPTPPGLGLLHRLAIPNGAEKVTTLLRRGANPNLRLGAFPGLPAITYHLKKSRFSSSITLLEHGADPTKLDEWGFDACLMAAWKGAVAFLKTVFETETTSWRSRWKRRADFRVRIGSSNVTILGCSALHFASFSGNIDCLKFYIDRNILSDVNITSANMFTPLHCAALVGNIDVIKFLLERGANINAKTDYGQLSLHHAAMNRQLSAVEVLIESGSQMAIDSSGMSPYLYALQLGNQAIIDCFRDEENQISSGFNSRNWGGTRTLSNRQQKGHAIALENAVVHGDANLCEKLYRGGCHLDADLSSCNGCSPLLLAIRCQKPDVIKWLLANGASTLKPKCKECGDGGPLDGLLKHTALNDVLGIVLEKYLSDGGSLMGETFNPVIEAVKNNNIGGLIILFGHIEQNAWHYANKAGCQWTKIVSILSNRPWNMENQRGSPSLHLAVEYGYVEMIECLIEDNAHLNASDYSLQTPLHIAAYSDGTEAQKIIEILIRHGAELELRDDWGWTPLMRATFNGRQDIFETLLNAGADPHTVDYESTSVAHISAQYAPGSVGILASLISCGINIHNKDTSGRSILQLAMCHNQFMTLVLNGNYNVQEAAPFSWSTSQALTVPSWLTDTFKRVRRRISSDDLRRIANTEPEGSWSPLCIAASLGKFKMMENLIVLDADLEFEGCPDGTALMVACRSGRLESVIFLVRRGAALSYHSPKGFRTAFDKRKTSKRILEWLLVTRFTGQPKIKETPHGNTSIESLVPHPWSGIMKAELVISGDLERRSDQSSKDYWVYLMEEKKKWRGKVVPAADKRRTIRPLKLIPKERVRIHPDGYEVPRTADSLNTTHRWNSWSIAPFINLG
ncbi:ankyrin [Hypoxylon trugodes]|uniref:ankyrin n=1 Tax=Hypoxylon trugodes TaxID=326681 RepID=UPI00218CED13|nr:ankyrin [Hypoxylon trugodes]KAI1383862.1 ankyrin [Hypoxylon trugodes]